MQNVGSLNGCAVISTIIEICRHLSNDEDVAEYGTASLKHITGIVYILYWKSENKSAIRIRKYLNCSGAGIRVVAVSSRPNR